MGFADNFGHNLTFTETLVAWPPLFDIFVKFMPSFVTEGRKIRELDLLHYTPTKAERTFFVSSNTL